MSYFNLTTLKVKLIFLINSFLLQSNNLERCRVPDDQKHYKIMTISVEQPPHRLESEHSLLFSKSALNFVEDLVTEFDGRVDEILLERDRRRLNIREGKWTPEYRNSTKDLEWNIGPLPKRLQNRKIDLGDVSPASTAYFVDTLFADVQGIQVCIQYTL